MYLYFISLSLSPLCICNYYLSFILVRLFDGLIDCALYYNTDPSTTTTGLSTLLIDKYLYDRAFEGKRRGSGSRETDSVLDEKTSLLMTASQNGIEISTILNLYKRWQRNGQTWMYIIIGHYREYVYTCMYCMGRGMKTFWIFIIMCVCVLINDREREGLLLDVLLLLL